MSPPGGNKDKEEDKSEGDLTTPPGGLPTDSTLTSMPEGPGGADHSSADQPVGLMSTPQSVGAGVIKKTNGEQLFNQTGELDITAIGNHLTQSNKCGPSISLPFQANTAHLNNSTNTWGLRKPDPVPDSFHNQAPLLTRGHGGAYDESTPPRQSGSGLSAMHIAARQVLHRELPVFTGKPEEWLLFISNYEQSTDRCGFSNEENLIRLQRSLKGAALEAVRGKLMCPSTVPYAIGTLRMLYGRPEVIFARLQRKLREEPAVRSNNVDSIIRVALAVQNYCATISAIGLHEYLHDPALLWELVEKLPTDLKFDWGRHRHSTGGITANLSMFDNWLFNVAMCASMVTPYAPNIGERRTTRERILVHSEIPPPDEPQRQTRDRTNRSASCRKCGRDHLLSLCPDFLEMSRNQRWDFVRNKNLCYCCLEDHTVRSCRSKRDCGVDGCRRTHHVLLDSYQATEEAGNATTGSRRPPAVLFHGGESSKALFRYIKVQLYGRNCCINTFALVDEGAACTLIEKDLADELGLDGPEKELCLRWTGEISQTEPASKLVNLQISAANILDVWRLRWQRTRLLANS
ncbi:uncharacterized protein [Drosophila takahashii]|uniref:uncharacterized protein n=1 Tax=Drosophila takahashii TaxID=29030 RepID=UPI00389918E8